ncbi:acetyltransferase domain-containing protein [Xylariaceae sp. FL0255]|nr:acetyltransferase domain-containing protein [Xylariaceae sp. FL0255]
MATPLQLNIFTTRRVKVRTTLPKTPIAPCAERAPIRTARLLLRAPKASDGEAMFEMRKDADAMRYTSRGLPDTSIEQSRTYLARWLSPNDTSTYYFTVVYLGEDGQLREEDKTAVIVGSCGAAPLNTGFWFGWPEIGYSIRKDYWGKGLATELMRGWLAAYWALPREVVEIEVHPDTMGSLSDNANNGEGGGAVVNVPERVTGLVGAENPASIRVLGKVGFQVFKRWEEIDNRPGLEGRLTSVIGVMASKPLEEIRIVDTVCTLGRSD